MYNEILKYEDLAVVTKSAFGDYKTLAFVSGNSKSEVIRKVKSAPVRYNVRMQGLIYIDHEDFHNAINSNLL